MNGNIEQRVQKTETELNNVKSVLKNVTGSPVIKAWVGSRLDLNDNLDCAGLNLMIERINERLAKLESRNA